MPHKQKALQTAQSATLKGAMAPVVQSAASSQSAACQYSPSLLLGLCGLASAAGVSCCMSMHWEPLSCLCGADGKEPLAYTTGAATLLCPIHHPALECVHSFLQEHVLSCKSVVLLISP